MSRLRFAALSYSRLGVLTSSSVPLFILLLAAIGAILIGPHGGLQVDRWAAHDEQAPGNDPYVAYMTTRSNEEYEISVIIV